MVCVTAAASRSGTIFRCMKDTGSMIRPMAEEDSSTAMETYMKAIGRTIKRMERECTCTRMGPAIPDSGFRISNMDSEFKSGSISPPMKGKAL